MSSTKQMPGSGELNRTRSVTLRRVSLATHMALLAGILLLVPSVANAQQSEVTEQNDSALIAALGTVRAHWTKIRVDAGGTTAAEGLFAGVRDNVVFVWPAPKKRIPLETIEAVYARRSRVGRSALIGAAVGGVLFGTLSNPGSTEDAGVRGYAAGAVLGAFGGAAMSFGGGPWERIYVRAEGGR